MSNLTKQVLAAALRQRLTRQPLDKITIRDLVTDAQVSRKTFYYHFQDIYDLLEWTLRSEGRRVLESHGPDASWQQKMWNTFRYLEDNQAVVLNIYRSIRGDTAPLERHVAEMIRPPLEQTFESQPGHEQVAAEDREFLLDLYSYGMVKLFLFWIDSGMKPEAGQMMARLSRLFDGSMEDFIRRYRRA